MKKRYDNKLTKYIIIIPLVSLILLSTILIILVMKNQDTHMKEDLLERKTLYINKQKEILNLVVNQAVSLICYQEDKYGSMSDELKNKLLQRISNIRFKDKGYLYVVDGAGTLKAHRKENLIGTNAFEIKDSNGVYYMKDGYELAKKYGQGFLEYISVTNEDKYWNNRKKLTYVKYLPKLDWAISSGVYISDIDAHVAIKELKIKSEYNTQNKILILNALIVTLIVIFLTILLSKRIAKRLYNSNTDLQKKIDEQTKELRSNIDFLNKLIDTVPVPIFIKDKDFIYIKCNTSFCKFLGLEKNEIIGKSVYDLSPKKLATEYHKKDIELIDTETQYYKSKVKSANDSIKVVELYKASYKYNYKFAGILGVVFDITDRELAHNKLKQKVADKTIENIQQTRQIEEEQLKNIKFTAIGQLAAGITHEINTPLTYIKGNFEMMQYDIHDLPKSDIKERMIDDSSKILDGINRISNIVESMREMSQKSKEAKENTNIYHAMVTSLTLLQNRSKHITKIKLNNKEFIIGLPKDSESYISNIQKQRLEQVFVIIVNNALDELVKINSFEEREIDISIFSDIDCITIKIKDNAGGISSDIKDSIFEPFISSKESSGIGIGLNVAKKIILDQEGIIEAYNEDKGAVFEIKLPKVKII